MEAKRRDADADDGFETVLRRDRREAKNLISWRVPHEVSASVMVNAAGGAVAGAAAGGKENKHATPELKASDGGAKETPMPKRDRNNPWSLPPEKMERIRRR
jgi:hypothetical protein